MTFLAVAALLLSAAAAATTTAAAAGAAATSSCAAQNILDACLQTENDLLNSCDTNDWVCKCNAYKLIVTCYNNCPGDLAKNTALGQQEIFCAYASQFPSTTTTAAAATPTEKAATKTGTAADSTATGTTTRPSKTGTATDSESSSAETNGASTDMVLHAGSILVAVAGMAAALI